MEATTQQLSIADKVFQRVNGSQGNPTRRTLDREQLALVNKLTPRRKNSDSTARLVERFLSVYERADRDITKRHGADHSTPSAVNAWNHTGRLQESLLIQEHQRGDFRICEEAAGSENPFSIDYFADAVAYALQRKYKKGNRLSEAIQMTRSGRWDNYRLREHSVDGVGRSQFGRYLDDIVRLGTWEMCRIESVAPIMGLIGNLQVDCGQQTLASELVPVDVWRELTPAAENQPTRFFGTGNPVETKIPLRHLLKFAYAINRHADCKNLDSELRKVMMMGAEQIDKYWAPRIVQQLFGIHASAAANEWRFELNGNRYANEYQEPAAAQANLFPYANQVYNQSDISRNDDALFVLIEQMFREQRDFRTGEPISCVNGLLDIIGTGFRQTENIMSGLGAVMLRVALGGVGNPTADQTRSARRRWNPDAFDNVWIEVYLRHLMELTTPWSNWTDAERTQAIERSIVTGNPRAAMVVTDEWAQEEFDMPTDWTDFDREVVWGRKFMRNSGLATIVPQARIVVTGWPDSQLIPNAPTDPFA